MTDPLAPLLDLAGVGEAAAEAREAVDRLLAHPALRRRPGRVGPDSVRAEAVLRSARASAELAGAAFPLDEVRAGTVTDPVVQGALRVAAAVGPLAGTWRRAPGQVLARLHLLAARDLVAPAALGRPVAAPEVSARLDGLARLVVGGTAAPAVVLAAVVHGELLVLDAFPGANGVVARAAARVTLVAAGLDPDAVTVPEVGHLARRPEYVGTGNAYATGTPDGVRAWLRHCCAAVALGAAETVAICDAVAA